MHLMKLLFCLILAALVGPASARAQATPAAAPGFGPSDFSQVDENGIPAGWQHRTKSSGYVRVEEIDGAKVVAIGVDNAGEDSFIQRVVKLPEGVSTLKLYVKVRHSGIVGGEKGFQTGFVQARWTNGGKEVGKWLDITKLKGDGDWKEITRTPSKPKDVAVDGLLLRVGMYGVKSGRVELAAASIDTVSAEQIAAERNKHRQMAPYGEKPSAERVARLSRGVNINNWFGQPYNGKIGGRKGSFTPEWMSAFITQEDVKLLKDAGFNNIRLPIEVAEFMDLKTGELTTELLPSLDAAIKLFTNAGMAVQVDFHPKERRVDSFNERPDQAELYVKWVGHISKHLAATTDPEMVFIELLNEPGGLGLYNERWQSYQDRLINEARANAPKHTLIVNAGGYMLITNDTLKFTPHPDRNVIVAVHYYEPSQFTHQGAVWMKDWYQPLRNIPWPFEEKDYAAAVENLSRTGKNKEYAAKSEGALKGMLKERLGTVEKMQENFQLLADWAKQHDVAIVINEYGVYNKYVDRESRLRYLRDISAAMAKHGFGATMWEYNQDFGFASGDPGARTLDAEVVRALTPPASSSDARGN
jgi:endoglucanase